MDSKTIFAANLKKYMSEHNKSRKEISEDLNISYYTFSDWVNGKKYPRMDKIEMLANYFNVTKSDLIEEEKEPEKSDTYQSMDISEEMGKILEQLHLTEREMTVDGKTLDKETRELLISSLENSLKIAKMMKNRNE